MSKAMRCKPSEVIGIMDPFIAYAFNSAVILWGTSFDAAIEEAVRGAKTHQEAENRQGTTIRRWIPSTRRYADPTRR